eukprot:SAG11_NODE_6106_length_1387_cov_1.763975_2_plen_145_part_00
MDHGGTPSANPLATTEQRPEGPGGVGDVPDLFEMMYPAYYKAAGRAVTASPLILRLFQAIGFWFGFTYVVVRLLGGHADTGKNGAGLEWIFDACLCFMNCVPPLVLFPSLACAFSTSGALNRLGLGSSCAISASMSRRRTLRRW